MFKNKPFLTAALLFGGVGLLILILATLSSLGHTDVVTRFIIKLFHMKRGSFTVDNLAELGAICAIPSFIFAYKSFCDTEDEEPTVETYTQE